MEKLVEKKQKTILIDASIEYLKLAEETKKEITNKGYKAYNLADKKEAKQIIKEKIHWEDVSSIVVLVSHAYLESSYSLLKYSSFKSKIIAIVLEDVILPEFFDKSTCYKPRTDNIPNYVAEVVVHSLNPNTLPKAGKIGSRRSVGVKKGPETVALSRDDSSGVKTDNLEESFKTLKKALSENQLTLVCGAGVSISSGISAWNDLLCSMFNDVLLSKSESDVNLDELLSAIPNSNLILGKYLKLQYQDGFDAALKKNLYRNIKKNPEDSKLIKSIVELCRPQRSMCFVNSIITYNFDDLIERAFEKNNVKYTSIWKEGQKSDVNSLPIYHVHGFLPNKKLDTPNLVFSEEAYHSQFIEPYSWGNLQQLNAFTTKVCLFVGISLSDPNLRRLLDVSYRKNEIVSHYIIMKRADKRLKCHEIADDLFAADARALGLRVMWCDKYEDIPGIISKIAK